MTMKADIAELARAAGFDTVAFTTPSLPDSAPKGLQQFLERGHHGEMGWMMEKAERRASPAAIWPEAKTVIVLGQNYAPETNPLDKLHKPEMGNISCYALGEDYHEVIKKKLKQFARAIAERFACDVKVFVDTAPVMEKPLAEQAGLGWQGKHTCIVSRDYGSWLFLGEIFTTLELPPDAPSGSHCGNCNACLDICPTDAFTAARELDARKCISYLTIEHPGHIDLRYRKAIGNRIYGCDDCLAICPWNKFAQTARESAYHARAELAAPLLADLLTLDDAAFRTLFRKSPVKRIGRARFLRNVLIAIGNTGNPAHIKHVLPLLVDDSALVRAMAVWALSQLASGAEYSTIREQYMPHEQDAAVNDEWNRRKAG